MPLQRRKLLKKFRQQFFDLGPQGVGGKLQFRRSNPAGDDVVRIDLMAFDGQPRKQLCFPLPLYPQRVKIGDKQTGLQLRQKAGQ